jgi:peptidoglycan/LPS O-acetylase OafA/YrhL
LKSVNALAPTYYPSIDGLRAIAVLLVLGFHAFPNLVPGGYIGVDIFFVISGYLITTIILRELNCQNFSLKDFYFRRARRILPALLITFIFAYVVGWFVFSPHEFENLNKQITAGSFFVANFILWKQSGYFDQAVDLKPFQHLWSLAIEEQFYLLWPVLLLGITRFNKNLIWVMIPIFSISFITNIWISQSNLIGAFYAPWSRFWELILGGVWAYLQIKPISSNSFSLLFPKIKTEVNWISKIYLNGFFIVGIILIGIGTFGLNNKSHFPGYLALLPTFGALIILIVSTKSYNYPLLGNKILVPIGLISYPLYLWHWVLLSYARILHGEFLPNTYKVLVIILSFVLAWLTYRFIEKPMRFGIQLNLKAKLLLVAALIIGLLAFITKEYDGFPQRFDVSSLTIEHQVAICDEKFTDTELVPCVFGNLKSEEQILVYGDSMAGQLTRALNDIYGSDYKITFLHHKDCFSSQQSGVDVSKKCALVWNEIIKFRNTQLAMIIHSQWWNINSFDAFSNLIIATTQNLGLQAKKFIIAGSTPWVDLNCYFAQYYLPLRQKQCLIDPVSMRSNEKFSIYTRQLNLPGIDFIYPFEIICPNGQCKIIEGSISNFYDTHHLSYDGALKVMPTIKAIFP